jgi:CDP-glucose 4,6-dehydratase
MGGEDPYSASKGCSELITHAYRQSFFTGRSKTVVASGRAGNVIGGGDWAENRIIPDIMRAYHSSKPVAVRNPRSVRPWQFVLEPVYGYLKLGEKMITGGAEYAGGWNFGPAAYENYNVETVTKEVQKLLPKVKFEIADSGDKNHEAGLLKLDITKAVNKLGWKPRLNFSDTIRYTIEGYLSESQGSGDIYAARLEQIKNYCKA